MTLQRGIDLPSQHRVVGDIPVLGSFGITGRHNMAAAPGPGVTIGRSGASIGVATYTPHDYWPLNTTLYAKDFRGNDPRFIYYLLKSIDFRAYNSGSAQPSLNRNYIANVPVSLPAIGEQQAIAEVLGALDDKVQTNDRLVPLLRDLASGLMQSRADPAKTYTVGDVADVRKGLSYTGAGLADAGMPMVNLANAADFGWLKRSGFKYYTGAYKPRHVAQPGSLLVSGVDLTWKLGIIGWPMLLPEDLIPALFSQDIFLVEFRTGREWLRLPLWAHLYTREARERLEGMAYGTTVARIPAEALVGMRFPAPVAGDPVMSTVSDLLRRAWAAERESASLVELRDALLLPLISGQLRIPDADSLVGDAV